MRVSSLLGSLSWCPFVWWKNQFFELAGIFQCVFEYVEKFDQIY